MKKSFIVAFALVILLSMAMGTQALASKTIERNNGESASASWTETDGNMVTDTYLSATKTNEGTDVYVEIWTRDITNDNYWAGKSGYIFTKDNIFSMDRKLNSASLSEVKLEVHDWKTDEKEPLTVRADWTGIGGVSKGSVKSSSTGGDYTFRSSESSTYREALVKGSINNCDMGEKNPVGTLVKFKSALMSMEK